MGRLSVAAPNSLHREIGVAVAETGTHLWIEKPVGLCSDDTRTVADAVARAHVSATVGFNYPGGTGRGPGTPIAVRRRAGPDHALPVPLLTDFAAHPDGILSWRFTREHGGTGVLNDLAVHGVDLVRFLVGDLRAVVADADRFIRRRPLAAAGAGQYQRAEDDAPTGEVENHDYVAFLGRTVDTVVFLEASRVAAGDQNDYDFEIHGTRGLISFDFRRARRQRLLDVPAGSGNPTGFDDLKVSEAAAFLRGIASGTHGGATLGDALAAGTVLDAVATSVAERTWVDLA